MVNVKKLGLVGSVGLAGISFLGGCNDALVRNYARVGGQQIFVSGVRREIEGPRGTTGVEKKGRAYVINNGAVKKGGIVIGRWNDYNRNEADEPRERLDDIGDSVNLSNVGLRIGINYYSGTPTNILFTFLDSNDNVVHQINCFKKGVLVKRGALPEGKYTIVAKYGNVIESRDFSVIR